VRVEVLFLASLRQFMIGVAQIGFAEIVGVGVNPGRMTVPTVVRNMRVYEPNNGRARRNGRR
jgi:hypothetical protein